MVSAQGSGTGLEEQRDTVKRAQRTLLHLLLQVGHPLVHPYPGQAVPGSVVLVAPGDVLVQLGREEGHPQG